MIRRSDGAFVKLIEIDPQGFSKLTNTEKNRTIDSYQEFLAAAPKDFQFKVVTEKTDSTQMLEECAAAIREEKNRYVKIAREDNYGLLERMSSGEAETRRYFMAFEYSGNPNTGKRSSTVKGIAGDLEIQKRNIDTALRECGNSVIVHGDETLFTLETLYRLLNRRSCRKETVASRIARLESDLSDYRWYIGDESAETAGPPAGAVIAPRGFDPRYGYLVMDGMYYTYIVLREDGYPQAVYAAWVGTFARNGCDLDLFFHEENQDEAVNSIETSLARKTSTLGRTAERSNRNSLSNEISSGEWILSRMTDANEKIYYCTLIITIYAATLEQLENRRGEVLNYIERKHLKAEKCGPRIEDYFLSTLPLCRLDRKIYEDHRRNMTTQGVASCYPFDEQRLRDAGGFPIGVSTVGKALAILNPFDVHTYRNANMCVIGPTGSGKTYFLLLLARRLRLSGIRVMMVLPQKGYEYRRNTDFLGGEFIRLCGGSSSCVNLLDISAAADLDAQTLADLEVTAKSSLQQKVDEITTFIELLCGRENGLEAAVSSRLEVAVVSLYGKFGITVDNRSLFDESGRKKQCPTLGDLYGEISGDPVLAEVRDVLSPFVSGALQNMNGQTNVDMSGRMITFDVTDAGKYRAVFFFLAVSICYSRMRENINDRSVLIMDEAWCLMDNRVAADYMKEVVKIVRGYSGSAVIATQNLSDIYNKVNGPEIVSGLETKFILQKGDGDDRLLRDVLHLTDRQIRNIGKQKPSEITMLSHNELYEITTDTSTLEFYTYTTAAGTKAKAAEYLENYYEKAFRRLEEEERKGLSGSGAEQPED